MITGWILDLIASAWEALLGAFPTPSEDSWMASTGSAVSWLADTMAGLGAWIPFALIGAILGTLGVVWGVGVGIRVGRLALSLFTGGGGA
jgi:hypothetical protein